MRLLPLLLLSLPLLLLFGLAKAEEADGKIVTTDETTETMTSPTTPPAPPKFCYDLENEEKIWCMPEKPFCKLSVEVNPNKVYTNKTGTTSTLRVGCIAAEKEGCQQNPGVPESYLCFCDSRIAARCNEQPEIIDRLKEIAAEMYRVAHSTTPPTTTTTTPDPNHYCLDGDEKKPCSPASFCKSMISIDLGRTNENGIGYVEKLPEEGLEDHCRKVEHFNLSVPLFECFCKSEVGSACNDLQKNAERKGKWADECGKLLNLEKKAAEEKKDKEMRKIYEDKAKDDDGQATYLGIGGGFVVVFLLVSAVVGVFIYRKCRKPEVVRVVEVEVTKTETDFDRHIRSLAQSIIEVYTNISVEDVMKFWVGWVKDKATTGNVPEKERLPVDVQMKDVIQMFLIRLVAATLVDPKFPDGKMMHWNYINNEKTLIAAMCPGLSQLPHFFLSAVRTGVECIVQLTARNEATRKGGKIMVEYLPSCVTPDTFCKGSIGTTKISVRIVEVETKPSFMRRKLEIDVTGDETGKSGMHNIDHFQYFDWEDHSLPTERGDIIDFTERVFKEATFGNKRTLVHCRGGIGRTGSFLVSLIMLKRAFDSKETQLTTEEVKKIAKSVRLHRFDAIQYPSQLAFAMYVAGNTLVQLASLPRLEIDGVKRFSVECNRAVMKAQVIEENDKEKAKKAEEAEAAKKP